MRERAISDDKKSKVEKLYYHKLFGMPEIAKRLGVSTDAVVSFMRRHKIKRRTFSEVQHVRFEQSVPSFIKRKLNSSYLKEQSVIVAMLYWGEGYKGSNEKPSAIVDFANSDPRMIKLFLHSLRSIYCLDEKRLRGYVYCYPDQNTNELIKFWSKLTKIPTNQFTKPYVRNDFKEGGRKMKYGLIHLRYSDKKLLIDIRNMIDYYVCKYAPIV